MAPDPQPRDRDRAAVYAAELAAFDGTDLEDVVPLAVLAERARLVTGSEWWPGPALDVRPARRDARSSTTRCDGAGATVRIAAGQSTVATLAHELAHALAGAARGHDAVFRQAYLDVVVAVTNAVSTDRRRHLHADQLADAFRAAGLAVAGRNWPPPTVGAAIAL